MTQSDEQQLARRLIIGLHVEQNVDENLKKLEALDVKIVEAQASEIAAMIVDTIGDRQPPYIWGDKSLIEIAKNSFFLHALRDDDKIRIEEILNRVARPTAPKDIDDRTEITRVYRDANSLPDPEKPSWAEVNRTKKRIDFRLDEPLLSEINISAKLIGLDRGEWLAKTFESFLKLHKDQAPPLAPSGSSKPCFVRLDPELLEKIDQAANHVHMKRSAWIKAVCYFTIHQPTPIPTASPKL